VISVVPAAEPADTVTSIIAVLWPDQDTGPGASGAAGGDHEAET
jgi:hypothetical protein